jgi:hypothetical protein
MALAGGYHLPPSAIFGAFDGAKNLGPKILGSENRTSVDRRRRAERHSLRQLQCANPPDFSLHLILPRSLPGFWPSLPENGVTLPELLELSLEKSTA